MFRAGIGIGGLRRHPPVSLLIGSGYLPGGCRRESTLRVIIIRGYCVGWLREASHRPAAGGSGTLETRLGADNVIPEWGYRESTLTFAR